MEFFKNNFWSCRLAFDEHSDNEGGDDVDDNMFTERCLLY